MTNKTLNVLVTGANGFLGSHIVTALSQHTHIKLIAACRNREKLPAPLQELARIGDLRDEDYVKYLVQDVDVICHAGTWSSMWNHSQAEYEHFFRPTINLIQQAKFAGVRRFIMTSTLVISNPRLDKPLDDFSETKKTKFWPHLDYLIEVDKFMQTQASSDFRMITMRLGHFVGAGNTLGIVPVLMPRLKTYLVPWLASGKSRMALVSGRDMARAFRLACEVDDSTLNDYESFNIVGSSFPSTREVINYLCAKSGSPRPLYSVPFFIGHGFAWLMEKMFPVLPGKAPFLTRSIVHLADDWYSNGEYAQKKLGYCAKESWQDAIDEALEELQQKGDEWPPLMQKIL